ncbi:MAG: 1-deoxy-D-xylulose-5-phosphate reductoisomerase [Defluviitaleaceae bacterium]|nr:1-deoxy-D-xylulose-5-phosphate reductoisomerase [Defluviitaleaceae bacterium]
MKNISLLGSTGSIGRQTLEVVRHLPGELKVVALAANRSVRELEAQINEFRPVLACVGDKSGAELLRRTLTVPCRVVCGPEGLEEAAAFEGADLAVNALSGTAGLIPAMAAIQAGKNLALANKETLVAAGEIVTKAAKAAGVAIYPIDSEHSAVWQCLEREGRAKALEKIYLTASGGPFRGRMRAELTDVTPEQALRHPNWLMGPKITVDSATMMNKGLEVIEAKWLFGVEADRIEVLVHPQSVVHSMVGFSDGAVIAQLGLPDMRVPIQYALTYPERRTSPFQRPDFFKIGTLTFEKPDTETFPCLGLAYEALRRGGTVPAVMNAANEAAVGAFLEGRIRFLDIPALIEKAMFSYNESGGEPGGSGIEEILEAEDWARGKCEGIIKG